MTEKPSAAASPLPSRSEVERSAPREGPSDHDRRSMRDALMRCVALMRDVAGDIDKDYPALARDISEALDSIRLADLVAGSAGERSGDEAIPGSVCVVPMSEVRQLRAEVARAREEGRRAGIEESIRAAAAEEELDGPITSSVLYVLTRQPEETLRSAVRATKRGIIDRLRSLAGGDAGPTNSGKEDGNG